MIRPRNKNIYLLLTVFLAVFLFQIDKVGAAAGCCSWHGGVSHCDTSVGKQVCKDGSHSPSCTCAKDPETKKNEISDQPVQQLSNKKWCGAGSVFENEDDAKKSITEYTEKIQEPLKNDIDRLDQEKKGSKITLYVLAAIIILLVIYSSFNKKQISGLVIYPKKHHLIRIIGLIVLVLFVSALIFYFSYFLPRQVYSDSQQWRSVEEARIEENNKMINSWMELQRAENEQARITESQKQEEGKKKYEEEKIKKEQAEEQKEQCLKNAQKVYNEKKNVVCKMLKSDYEECIDKEYYTKDLCSSMHGIHYSNGDCDLPYDKKSDLESIINEEKKKCN